MKLPTEDLVKLILAAHDDGLVRGRQEATKAPPSPYGLVTDIVLLTDCHNYLYRLEIGKVPELGPTRELMNRLALALKDRT